MGPNVQYYQNNIFCVNDPKAGRYLLAGFTKIDISHEPIFARAAVFERDSTKLRFLVLDLLGIGHKRAHPRWR